MTVQNTKYIVPKKSAIPTFSLSLRGCMNEFEIENFRWDVKIASELKELLEEFEGD